MRALICIVAGLAAVAAVVIGILAYRDFDADPVRSPAPIGKADIGGPFALVDENGQTVTEKAFAGQATIVYFGFTFCPDICPTELLAIGDALALLPPENERRFQPVFITVDPERDTPDIVGEYARNFHPRMIGLTGSPEQVKAAASAYRVYYAKQEPAGEGPYTMAHSSFIYLMDEQGEFVRHFRMGTSPEEIADALRTFAAGS